MTESDMKFLMRGTGDFFGAGEPFDGDMAAARRAWKRHRASIMQTWINENPGSRPAAWWRFDAKEARGLLPGESLDYVPDRNFKADLDDFRFGIEFPHTNLHKYETELQYLLRHNLLTADERKLIETD